MDCIYFLLNWERLAIKIGFSGNDVARRLSALQIGCPDPLTVMGVMPGPRELEEALHGIFAHHHIRGEWFFPGDDLLGYMATHTRSWEAWQRMAVADARRLPTAWFPPAANLPPRLQHLGQEYIHTDHQYEATLVRADHQYH